MTVDPADLLGEIASCYVDPAHFVSGYCLIEDVLIGEWVSFDLWPAQRETLRTFEEERLVVALKARQLGLSWLCIAFALWLMVFRPAATVLLFSRRDDEAVALLDRLRGMYGRLPVWMLSGLEVAVSNAHNFELSNGSTCRAFPTTAGDSYSATLAIVDEADLVPNLGQLMRAVKPTIDAGGRMFLVSRADKSAPNSEFKAYYRAAKQGLNEWVACFLPWHARPDRDHAWYAAQRLDVLTRTGSLDDLHEQYPATDVEALSARTLDKRIPPEWLIKQYNERRPIEPAGMPALPGLRVYIAPVAGRRYALGADPAEGNPTSDASTAEVLDYETGEEMATIAGKFQPDTFAGYINQLGQYYNGAEALIERNNHGHAVLLWLREFGSIPVVADRSRDNRPGWLSNSLGKARMYDEAAVALRDGDTIIHDFDTYNELASIEGSTLRAPHNGPDNRADAFALAQVLRRLLVSRPAGSWGKPPDMSIYRSRREKKSRILNR